MNARRRGRVGIVVAAAAALVLAACGSDEGDTTTPSDEGFSLDGPASMIIPFGTGGGIDLAGRTVVDVMSEEKIVDETIRVENIEGGNALLGMSRVKENPGSSDTIMVLGTHIVVSPLQQSDSNVSYEDFTPLATLFAEYVYILAPTDSRFKDIQDLADALKSDPGSVKIGGGTPGGSGHLALVRFASGLGVDPGELTYVAYDANEAIPAVLGGHVDIATGGPELLEFVESGDLKALAVSSEEPLDGPSKGIPIFSDAGSDGALINWRIVVGPPDMPADAVKFWQDALIEMSESPSWEAEMAKYGWSPFFKTEGLGEFVAEQHEIFKTVLTDVGVIDG